MRKGGQMKRNGLGNRDGLARPWLTVPLAISLLAAWTVWAPATPGAAEPAEVARENPSLVRPFHPAIPNTGRMVAVDVHPTNHAKALAASESGGLFQTTDSGEPGHLSHRSRSTVWSTCATHQPTRK